MLSQWYQEREHQKIYDYVSSKPIKNRSNEENYYLMYSMNRLHKFHETLEIGENILESITNEDNYVQLKYYYEFLMALYRSGTYKKAIKVLEQLKSIHDKIDYDQLDKNEKTNYISYYNHAGIINYALQNFDIALQHYDNLFEYGEENNDLIAVTVGAINKGEIHEYFGQFNQAIDAYHTSLEYSEETGRIGHKLTSLNNLTSVLHKVGRLDEAEAYANQAIEIMRQRDDVTRLAKTLGHRASVYSRKGKFEKAKIDLLESYELRVEIGNDYDIARLLYQLVDYYLQQEDRENAVETLRKYKMIYDKLEVKDGFYELAEAQYLKTSSFYKHKIKAEEILRKIINQTDIGTELRLIASLNLLELLILQIEDQNNLENLLDEERRVMQEEIMEIYHDILDSQEVMDSPLLLIQIYYIRAHLHLFFMQPELVEGELKLAEEINNSLGVVNFNLKEPTIDSQFRDSFPSTLQQSLNKIIHSEPRLKIILALINNTKLVFTELQDIVGLTPGNLGRNCDKLVEAGYIFKSKEIVDDKFLTTYSLTPEGINEFKKYRDFLSPFFQ